MVNIVPLLRSLGQLQVCPSVIQGITAQERELDLSESIT